MELTIEVRGIARAAELATRVIPVRSPARFGTFPCERFFDLNGGPPMGPFSFEAVEISVLKNCIVLPTGLVLTMDGWVVRETLEGSLENNGVSIGCASLEIGGCISDPVVAASKFGTFNYSVFLHEVMPPIYVGAGFRSFVSGFLLSFPSFFPEFRRARIREMSSHVWPGGDLRLLDQHPIVASEVWVVSAGEGIPNRGRIKSVHPSMFADLGLALPSSSVNFGERIYVLREEGSIRSPLNRAELLEWCRINEFAPVELAALEVPEQAAAFHQAKIVVAEHGAGLANLWYCRRGTKVVELFPRELVGRWVYRAVSEICGYDYVAASFATPEGWVWNRDQVTVPIETIEGCLVLGGAAGND